MNLSRFIRVALATVWVFGSAEHALAKKHVVTRTKGSSTLRHAVGHSASVRGAHAALRKVSVRGVPTRHPVLVHATAESRRLTGAFIASAMLRPMAQQLLNSRSSSAYNGVLAYAVSHPGEAAATANLAIGHALSLDHRFGDAENAFHSASQAGQALSDYADYLGAQAAISAGKPGDAVSLLEHFGSEHADSLFVPQAPVLLATAYLAQNDSANALRVLEPLKSGPIGSHLDFRSALARTYQTAGDAAKAAVLYRDIYLNDPLTSEAANAKAQLASLNAPLTVGERKQHADALFNAKQYSQATAEYRALQQTEASLTQADRDALEIYIAVCDLRLKRLSRTDVDHLPVTGDDSAALKMYLQSELARNEGNSGEQDSLVQSMLQQYPNSRWLEEALYSGGNMYLIKRDPTHAIADYSALVSHFPRSTYAPSAHWRTAWLSYRLRRMPDAARLFDEQITSFPGGTEIPGALYWRGRLYEDIESDPAQALNYYKMLNAAYVNSYYANLARQRISALGARPAAEPSPALASVRAIEDPHLIDAIPEDDPHLIKAKLLANAALNEYIRPELQLSASSGQWGALAEAQIYQSFGENARALQAMKRSKVPFFSLPVAEVPLAYWQLVFPRPYWSQLASDAQGHGLDPYLVTSLVRQESEFNPGVVSRANAYGLMQLLPTTGKMLAKQQGERHFDANELFDPTENLRLGTAYLRQNIDHYGGQVEYALAAYNAGDGPVRQWIASGDYKDIPEWVESIPYSETRDYVQSIMRNREVYRAVYAAR